MKIYAYVRTSTNCNSISLTTQEEICSTYAKNNGYQIEKIFKDPNVSGTSPLVKRPGLSAAVDTLSLGDFLIVVRRDRLGRKTNIMEDLQRIISSKGARIISTWGEGTENDDPHSLSLRNLADSFSEYEHRLISCRTHEALQSKKARGERVGFIPFGHRLSIDGIHLKKDVLEQNTLKQMRELKSNGLSIRKIAEELNKRGTFNRGNSPWNNASVHRQLNQQKAA